jgi:hypothetical protein
MNPIFDLVVPVLMLFLVVPIAVAGYIVFRALTEGGNKCWMCGCEKPVRLQYIREYHSCLPIGAGGGDSQVYQDVCDACYATYIERMRLQGLMRADGTIVWP